MFQHCPVYPCRCLRCQTGIDMGLVSLVRDGYLLTTPAAGRSDTAYRIISDCAAVLANDARYPKANAIALARLQAATGFSFS